MMWRIEQRKENELARLRRVEAATKEAHELVIRQKAIGDELLDDVAQVYVALAELQDAVEKCVAHEQ